MPTFQFRAGDLLAPGSGFLIGDAAGSGLGFFGSGGAGNSIQVGKYNKSTYVVNSGGQNAAQATSNIEFATGSNSKSGYITANGNALVNVAQIPNWQSTLNIRLLADDATPITPSNVKVWMYDRSDKNNWPSGVTTQLVEAQHTGISTSTAERYGGAATGNVTWVSGNSSFGGSPSGYALNLYSVPGVSGITQTGSTRHDWYLNVSVSPDSVGEKRFGLWVDLEYTT